MKYKQLSQEQRYAISVLLNKKCTKSEIAHAIGVHPSTITREIARNGTKRSYHADTAQKKARRRKDRLRSPRKYTHQMKREVHRLIREQQWSPKQICGYYKRLGKTIVSHETIYADLRFDKLHGGDLWKQTRHKMKYRSRALYVYKTPIPNRLDIDQRPKEADGSRLGDFEMDLIMGSKKKQAILTLIDRHTHMGMMQKLPLGRQAKQVALAVYRLLLPYKKHLKTITTDNGPEFAAHELITKLLGVKVYFAKPYHSWEKGCIENYNKLVRQYIPKGADFDKYDEKQIMQIQKKINNRPREKHKFKTPKQLFYELIDKNCT